MSESPPPERTAASTTRDRIKESALELFATNGFGSTSVKAIAARAGVSPGLIYTYFESKDALLRAVFEEGIQQVWSTLEPREEERPAAALESLIRQSFATVEEHQNLWRLLYALRTQPGVIDRLRLEIATWNAAVEAELEKVCRRAHLPEPAVAAKLLFAIIDGANQHRMLDTENYPTEEIVRLATSLLSGQEAK